MADEEHEPGGDHKPKSDKDKNRTYLLIGVGVVGLIIAYLTLKSISNKNAAATGTGTVSTPSYAYGNVGAGNPYNTQMAYLNSSLTGVDQELSALLASETTLSKEIKTQTAQIGTLRAKIAAGSGTTGGHGTASSTGGNRTTSNGQQNGVAAQTITIGGVSYDILGRTTHLTFEVGGGAPVYFGNANAISQGPGQDLPGNYAYVPEQYNNLVTKGTGRSAVP